jgi:hypothetical protein
MAKGSEFERYISKFLTKWLTGKTKPYMFWRQDASGGIATIHFENCHMTGDICSVHPDSRFFMDVFSIECKTGYPKTSFWQHFKGAKFGIEEFWLQALRDAEKSSKNPLLIYRKKGRKSLLGINSNVEDKLFDKLKDLNKIIICWKDIDDCILYDMESFFEKVKPDDIRNIK